MRYYAYDYEATGADVRFDQPFQKGVILYDGNLQEIERHEFRCRPDPHVLAHPAALIVTGQYWSALQKEPMSHYQMQLAIDRLIRRNLPCIFVGQNIFKFDEEMQRHARYQCGLDPYLTSKPGSGRMDTLPMMRATYALRRSTMTWPYYEDGRPSFRLEQVAPLNGFENHAAHDAMGDVEATGHICRIIRESNPDLWAIANKMAYTKEATSVLTSGEPHWYVEARGETEPVPIVIIAKNPDNPKEMLGLNLRYGVDAALAVTAQEAVERVFNREEREAKGQPFLRVRANQFPMIFILDAWGSEEERASIREEAQKARFSMPLEQLGIQTLREFGGDYQNTYIEQQLYNGFLSNRDQKTLERFHDAPPASKLAIAAQVEDPRYKAMVRRIIHIEHRDQEPEHIQALFDAKLAQRLIEDKDVPWTTLPAAKAEITRMREEGLASPKHGMILDDYMSCLEALENDLVQKIERGKEVEAMAEAPHTIAGGETNRSGTKNEPGQGHVVDSHTRTGSAMGGAMRGATGGAKNAEAGEGDPGVMGPDNPVADEAGSTRGDAKSGYGQGSLFAPMGPTPASGSAGGGAAQGIASPAEAAAREAARARARAGDTR